MIDEINEILLLKSKSIPNFTTIHKKLIELHKKTIHELIYNDQQFNNIKLREIALNLKQLLDQKLTERNIKEIKKLEDIALKQMDEINSESQELEHIHNLTHQLYSCTSNNRNIRFRVPNHLKNMDREFWIFNEKLNKIYRTRQDILYSTNINNIKYYKNDACFSMRQYVINAIELENSLIKLSSGNKEILKSIIFKKHENPTGYIFSQYNTEISMITNSSHLLIYGCLSKLETLLKEYVNLETTG